MSTTMLRKGSLPFTILITSGLFLRLLFLSRNDLWHDEVFTITLSENAPFIWNPPLYFLLMKIWIKLFGISELSLRLPSALFSAGSLLMIYLLTKKLFDKKAALIALTIGAFSPFHLWYAQEARPDSLAVLLGLLSSYFLLLWLKENKTKYISFYVLFSVFGIYSHYFCLLLFFSQIACSFLFFKEYRKKLFVTLLPLAFFLPWVFPFLKKVSFLYKGFWIPQPMPKSLVITVENFILGYNGTQILYILNNMFLTLLLITIFVNLIMKISRKEILFSLILFVLPILCVYLFSLLFFSIYLDRCFLIFTPYCYILIGWAIKKIPNRILKIFALSFLVILLAIGALRYFSNQIYMPNECEYHRGVFIKKPFRPLAKFLKDNLNTKKDFLILGNHSSTAPLGYYLGMPQKEFFTFSSFVFDPDILDANTQKPYQKIYKEIEFFVSKDKILDIVKTEPGKIFFIGCDWPRSSNLDKNCKSIKKSLDKNLELEDKKDFDGLRVFIYEQRSKNN